MPVINKKPLTKKELIEAIKLMEKVYPMPGLIGILRRKNASNK